MKSMTDIIREVDDFFMDRSPIHDTMRRLTQAMRELNIPFAIAGAMAANAHGHRRTTADVDILLRREDLARFKERWLGRGWLEVFEGSKAFRDTISNVKVDVLIVGDYPGDGLAKPVSFPVPETVVEIRDDGLPYISLKTLLELKLASGLTAKHRPRDLDDVIQLIKANSLPASYADNLDPFVRDKFVELWHAAQIVEDY
jgi:hypothetical protein